MALPMMVWIFAAVLIAVTLFALMRPLTRQPAVADAAQLDVAYYRAQQDDIARQLAAGAISETEAKAADAEAGRRLISRTREAVDQPTFNVSRARAAAIAMAIVVPACTLGIYLTIGAPTLPAQPYVSRTDINRPQQEFARLVDRLDAHLADAPDDAKGFELAFPVYMRMGRFDSAVEAAQRLLALKGESADGLIALAEAQIFAARGVVSDDARRALARALELSPESTRAEFYNGLAIEQAGEPQRALSIWTALRDRLPQGPERKAVEAQIARLGTQSGPSGATGDAIRALPQGEQRQAIRSMVDGLEARLKADGGTAAEWQRLIRALTVLGEIDRANDAVSNAKRQYAADQAVIGQLDGLASELSLSGKGPQ